MRRYSFFCCLSCLFSRFCCVAGLIVIFDGVPIIPEFTISGNRFWHKGTLANRHSHKKTLMILYHRALILDFLLLYLLDPNAWPPVRWGGNFNNIINKNGGMSPNSQRRHPSYYCFNLYFSFSSSAPLFKFLDGSCELSLYNYKGKQQK
jgi:hypothetical protein